MRTAATPFLQGPLVDVPEDRVEAVGQQSRLTIPDPMTPPPSMATFLIFGGSIFSIRGSLPAARVFRKMPMRFLATSETAQSAKSSASLSRSASKSPVKPSFHGLDGLEGGDISLGLFGRHALAKAMMPVFSSGVGQLVDLVPGHARSYDSSSPGDKPAGAAFRAVSTKLAGRDDLIESPFFSPSSAEMGLPVVIIVKASAKPTRRASRWVPPAPGNQADLDFRLADLHSLGGHPVMAGHGDLQPAAQAVAVDGRDHRLGAFLDGVDETVVLHDPGKEKILVP